uniref:Uncharacterized protein n=1 Tax=Arundo donax TaxID=35708 RepID=A0A0A9A2Y5_ARUDO
MMTDLLYIIVSQVKLPTETKHTKNASKDEIQLGKQLDKDKMGEENVSSVRCFHSSEPLPADMTSFFCAANFTVPMLR